MMGDWLRRVLYTCFILVFIGVMYSSFQKIFSGNTAVSQVQRTSRTLLYPSVTICPGFNNASLTAKCPTDQGVDSVGNKIEDFLFAFVHSYEDGNT